MFILTKISDLVQITPADLKKPSAQAIEDNINAKYANKVIQKIGLCICMYDLLWASEGLIGHGTGIVNVNVEFRLVVFRPFKHEVMIGRISSSDQWGINSEYVLRALNLTGRMVDKSPVRTQFFDSIRVPALMLPATAFFDHGEQVWVWRSEDGLLYYDHAETVRFRVEAEHWVDKSPPGPNEKDDGLERRSPYTIDVSMGEDGLGPVLWWD